MDEFTCAGIYIWLQSILVELSSTAAAAAAAAAEAKPSLFPRSITNVKPTNRKRSIIVSYHISMPKKQHQQLKANKIQTKTRKIKNPIYFLSVQTNNNNNVNQKHNGEKVLNWVRVTNSCISFLTVADKLHRAAALQH